MLKKDILINFVELDWVTNFDKVENSTNYVKIDNSFNFVIDRFLEEKSIALPETAHCSISPRNLLPPKTLYTSHVNFIKMSTYIDENYKAIKDVTISKNKQIFEYFARKHTRTYTNYNVIVYEYVLH